MPAAPTPPADGLQRFVRFGVVGVSGMVVDYGTFAIAQACGLVGGLPVGPVLLLWANMVSVAVAIQNNFLWNRWWTFADRRAATTAAQWKLFTAFSAATWLLNNLIVGLLEGGVGQGASLTWFGVTFQAVYCWKAIAIAICTVANFLLSARIAFK